MDRRRELRDEYKQREVVGGVLRIVNASNGKYLIFPDDDVRGAQNRFDFSKATGSCVELKLQSEWDGGKPFEIEVLEELKMKPEQSRKEFKEDLATLADLWREKFDSALSY